MSASKFRFVSPGVFVNEVDESQLATIPSPRGPVIIGRSEKGPAYRPIKVNDYEEFVKVFGNPIPGNKGGDVWRNGNYSSPTYGAYAAEAYLKNNSPLTFVRLLGSQKDSSAASKALGASGWATDSYNSGSGAGAWGLFLINSSSGATNIPSEAVSGTLAAIFYCMSGTYLAPSGNVRGHLSTNGPEGAAIGTLLKTQGAGPTCVINLETGSGDGGTNTIRKVFNFNQNSDQYIRKVFNTNPQKVNSNITDNLETYWLGQSYERAVNDMVGSSHAHMLMLPLKGASADAGNYLALNSGDTPIAAETGYFISQDQGDIDSAFNPETDTTELFKIVALNASGEWEQRNLKISITDLRMPTAQEEAAGDAYPTFGLEVRKLTDNDTNPVVLESYANLNLNPNSANFIARRLGDAYVSYNTTTRRFEDYGDYANVSSLIRVVLSDDVKQGLADPILVPFGIKGPLRHAAFAISGSAAARTNAAILKDSNSYKVAIKAVGTVKFESDTMADYDDETFTVKSTDDTQVVYTLDDDVAFGSSTFSTSAVTVGIQGLSNGIAVASKVQEIFDNASCPHVDKITATTSGDTLILTQDVAGTAGNNTMSTSDSTDIILVGFRDGQDGGTTTRKLDDDHIVAGGIGIVGGGGPSQGGHHIYNDDSDDLNTGFNLAGLNHPPVFSSSAGVSICIGSGTLDATGSTSTNGHNYFAYVQFPAIPLINSSSQMGFTDPRDAYFGVDLAQSTTATTRFERSTWDILKALPSGLSSFAKNLGSSGIYAPATEHMWTFTLDDVYKSGTVWVYDPGARANSSSFTAASGSARELVNTQKISKFTTVMHGGFDGLDITEKDPFRNTYLDDSAGPAGGTTEETNYAVHSIQKALDVIRDPEITDFNLAAMPGITVPALTDNLIDLCEKRADALAVVDLQHDYRPLHEGTVAGGYPLRPSVKEAVASMSERSTDSSYGCAYFPFVQVRDQRTNQFVWVPPSVAALGTMARSAAKSELWFAPAGFNRARLTNGHAGLPVIKASAKLNSQDRDDLYEVRINPIATFTREGTVVFGQKTMQLTPSALDRINVRRLLIFLKKEISVFANGVLFDPNVDVTWKRFLGKVEPFLRDVKTRFGLSDYKVVLDKTTTTPDLIDRNILYAKIFLKPARAIEFIAIDFIVTKSGASFED